MSASQSDRNVLFGLLALQMEFITQLELMAALQAWTSQKSRPLGELLVELGHMSAKDRAMLEPMVDRHIERHGGSAKQSLASLSSLSDIVAELRELPDTDVLNSLSHVAGPASRQAGDMSGVIAPNEGDLPAESRPDDEDEVLPQLQPTMSFGHAQEQEAHSRFLLLRPHAEGGLGKVWIAQDRELNREVAFKEIQPKRAHDPNSRGRFVLEAEITGGLEHPGIVPVYGLGHFADGRPFYAMRFIRGRSLQVAIKKFHTGAVAGTFHVPSAILRLTAHGMCLLLSKVIAIGRQPSGNVASRSTDQRADAHRSPDFVSIEFRNLVQRLIDVCNAIAYAHSRGVLHRDLKPGNIMLGKYGETLVVDWGLAKAKGQTFDPAAAPAQASLDREPSLTPQSSDDVAATQMGSAIGTPKFMSPEQAAGRLDLLSPAADVYSLGATLYELLTGQAPIGARPGGDSEKLTVPEVLRRVEQGEFPAPRSVLAAVPAPLEAVCLRAMSREPHARYATAQALAEDLECWLAGEPVSAYREPLSVRLGRWVRRHRAIATAAGTLSVAVLIAAALFAGMRWQREQILRGQVQTRIDRAEAANQEGNLDLALVRLAEAAGLSIATPELADLRRVVRQRQEQLETFLAFTREANELVSRGVHGIRALGDREAGVGEDRQIVRAEKTLGIYGGLNDPNWLDRLNTGVLTTAQVAEVRRLTADLLIMTAVRLALFDTNDDEGKARTRKALTLFDRAAVLREPTPGIWMLRMLWHRRLGEAPQADAAGETMTRLVKTLGRAAFNDMDNYLLGSVTLNILKQPAKAIAMYQSALARNPRHYGAALGLFFAHRELKDLAVQVMALRVAMALNPEEPDLYYFLGFTEFSRRNYEEALLTFRELTRRAPEHVQGHYWLGRCEIIAENYSEADKALTRSLELDPSLPSPVSWRAVVRGHLPGRHRDAVADAEAAVLHATVDDGDCWRAARAYALSASVIRADLKASPDDLKLIDPYGARAVQLLKDAVQRGFIKQSSDIISIDKSTDLDAIRDRPDFQEFLGGLKTPLGDWKSLLEQPAKVLPVLLETRAIQFVQVGRTADAVQAVAKLRELGTATSGQLYNAACVYSLCAASIKAEKDQLTAEQSAQRQKHIADALATLREAIKAGWNDFAHMQKDPDLKALHDLPEFQNLIPRK